MKKFLAIILVCFMTLSFVACGGDGDEGSAAFSNTENSTNNDTSKNDSSKDDTSKTESSDASSDASSEVSDEPVDGVVYTDKFVSWVEYTKLMDTSTATIRASLKSTDPTSLRLSKINEAVGEGDNGIFTSAYGETIEAEDQSYGNYAVAVVTYDHSKFSYIKTAFYKAGEADPKTAIPEDGFVIVIWKGNAAKINAIEAANTDMAFFAHGIVVNNGLDAKIKAAATAPVIDGQISSAEYGSAVWNIDDDNELVSYIQFEVGDYYASADVYLTYDAKNLYIGVIVDSPTHFNNLPAESATSMWKLECIQVNLSAYPANSEYISENWDYATNQTAVSDNAMRQYGFAVNDDGETIDCVYMPSGTVDNNYTVKCVRDDAASKTYYEAAIAWDELGSGSNPFKAPVKGDQIGVSVSINCGNEEKAFKTIQLRDGGGIIGINDWSKIPTITLD